jgi:DNA-binding response OmpR family regulator
VKSKVLVACRDELCLERLKELLSFEQLTFITIDEDTDLLLEILDRDYALIIYGLEKSDPQGLKMIRILRKMRPKVPLIVISDDPCEELGGKVLHEGVIHYAVRPFNPAAIKNAITTAIGTVAN